MSGLPPEVARTLHEPVTALQKATAALASRLDRLCDPAARVSAHYLVEEDGALWRLVPEARRAFHAGVSCWQGDHDLNFVSIGVEIVNPGHEWGYRRFPEPQMVAVEALCRDILSRHRIPLEEIPAFSFATVADQVASYGNPLPNTLHLNGTFTIKGLQGSAPLANTTLEIGRSTVFISYGSSDPLSLIQGYLKNGFNSGGWNGTATASTGRRKRFVFRGLFYSICGFQRTRNSHSLVSH